MEPTKFGKYLLVEMIAAGGMAEIYKAYAKTPEGKVYPIVIKRILPQFAKDDEFISLLIDEAKVMVFMNHPNIVSIVEFGKVDETYYIAMEYVEGPTLQKLFRKIRESKDFFDISMALYIIRDIASGLGYAHRKTDQNGNPMHIVHRDISPANILMSYNGDVKITDFGISKAANQNHHTQVGIIRGKTGYMSPEQTRAGMEIDGRSDLFSLGIILYELLTSQRLFRADSVPKALKLVREANIPSMKQYREDIPEALEQIVHKALSFEKKDRFQNGEAFCDAINEFLTKHSMNNQFRRITHTDLMSYLNTYFGNHPDSPDSPNTLGKTKSAGEASSAKIFAENPIFKTHETQASDLDQIFDKKFGEAKSLKNKNTQSLDVVHTAAIKPRKQFLPYILGALSFFICLSLAYWGGSEYLRRQKDQQAQNLQNRKIDVPVATDPPGAEIYIDNVRWPEVTPTTISIFENKTVTLILSKQDHKNEIRVIEANEGIDLNQIKLIPIEKEMLAKYQISSTPKGAEIWMNGKNTKEKTPYELKLKIGQSAKIKLVQKGYQARDFEIHAKEVGNTAKTFFLTKVEKPVKKRAPRIKPMNRLGGKKKKAVVAKVSLNVASSPWAEVYLDGKKVGVSPFVGLKVTPGKHQIKFVNADLGLKPFEKTVVFQKGKDVRCLFNLNDQTGSCDPIE